MEHTWYHKGSRRWNNSGEEWLCLRKRADEEIERIVFTEGSHHYFKEMHVDLERADMPPRRLDGPGPFDLVLRGQGECLIFVRVQFLRYHKSPCKSGEVFPARCADVHTTPYSEPEPVYMQIVNEHAAEPGPVSGIFPPVDLARRKLTRSGHFGVPVLCLGDFSTVPFYLREPVDSQVLVLLFGSSESAPVLPENGESVRIAPFEDASVGSCQIQPGQSAPGESSSLPQWTVAVPVVCGEDGCGIFGQPLAVSPLIANMDVTVLPPMVFARWDWLAPTKWLTVKLSWRLFDEHGQWFELGELSQDMEVGWNHYGKRNNVEVLNYMDWTGLHGYNIQVTATPYLMGEKVPKFDPLVKSRRL